MYICAAVSLRENVPDNATVLLLNLDVVRQFWSLRALAFRSSEWSMPCLRASPERRTFESSCGTVPIPGMPGGTTSRTPCHDVCAPESHVDHGAAMTAWNPERRRVLQFSCRER